MQKLLKMLVLPKGNITLIIMFLLTSNRIQILRRAKELCVKITNQKSAKITKLEEILKKHSTK